MQLKSLLCVYLVCVICHHAVGTNEKAKTGDENKSSNSVITPRTSLLKKQREILEPNGKFVVEWETDLDNDTITFEVTAATTGFVGFGLSPSGGMQGSDIIVGGIDPNGNSYFSVCGCAISYLFYCHVSMSKLSREMNLPM